MADKLPFYKIGEANAEIERLNTLVADRDSALSMAQAEITALKSTKPSEEVAKLTSDLTTERASTVALTAQVAAKDTEIGKLKTDLAAANTKAAADASRMAASITAGQGQPPIKAPVPADAPAAGAKNGTLTEQCIAANKAKQSRN